MIAEFTSRLIPLQGVASSLQGGRPENQDDWGFLDTPLGFLLVVCDGMGGGPGGKTASYIVKNEMMAALRSCSQQTSPVDAIKMAVSRANDALYQKMDEMPQLRGMGSTLVAILINQHSAIIAHLGDSRCYRISNGRIVYRTEDHSLVGELVRNKALTEEQARTSPQSNVITRALGNTDNHVAEIAEVPFCKGDRFLLCTDGVWGIMPHEQLKQRLVSHQTLTALVDNLQAEVDQIGFSTDGHHDNHTLVAVQMNSDSILKDKMNKLFRIILGSITVLLVISLGFNVTSMVKLRALSRIGELETQNQKLQSKIEINEDITKGNTKDLITQIELLKNEKILLLANLEQHKARIDSLEKIIQQHSVTHEKISVEISAKNMAQQIINLFTEMENGKAESQKDAVKQKGECKKKIEEKLKMLDKKTAGKYSSTIDGINRKLSDPLLDKVEVIKGKKTFVSTSRAKKEIQKLSKKVEEIKSQLR